MAMPHHARKARLSLAFSISVALLCGFRCSLPWSSTKDETLSIVSYNAHNFFDATEDGGEYPEFTRKKGWDERLYKVRLENLAKAVLSFFPSGKAYPDILCLEEIESVRVLEDLADGPLKSAGYSWLGLGGPQESPIRSAFLSRRKVTGVRAHALSDSWGMGAGREIVELTIDLGQQGSPVPSLVTLFICHWKSRKEGAELTEPARREASRLVAGRISELLRIEGERPIICLGDFNESPDEFERNSGKYPVALMPSSVAEIPGSWRSGVLKLTGDGRQTRIDEGEVTLFSPWYSSSGYSYRFQGRDERLDGFLLSPGLFDGQGIEYRGFQVSDDPSLVDESGAPRGWDGKSGFSDHLPILLTLDLFHESALTNPGKPID